MDTYQGDYLAVDRTRKWGILGRQAGVIGGVILFGSIHVVKSWAEFESGEPLNVVRSAEISVMDRGISKDISVGNVAVYINRLVAFKQVYVSDRKFLSQLFNVRYYGSRGNGNSYDISLDWASNHFFSGILQIVRFLNIRLEGWSFPGILHLDHDLKFLVFLNRPIKLNGLNSYPRSLIQSGVSFIEIERLRGQFVSFNHLVRLECCDAGVYPGPRDSSNSYPSVSFIVGALLLLISAILLKYGIWNLYGGSCDWRSLAIVGGWFPFVVGWYFLFKFFGVGGF